MNITVVDQERVKAMLAAVREEYPKAAKYAQDAMIRDVWTAEKEQMKADIDRPTPWSVNSLLYKKAEEPNALNSVRGAAVFMKNQFGSGSLVNPEHYLGTQILGGETAGPRRSEKVMRQLGYLRPGYVWTPGWGAKLDQYGNIPGGTIQAILGLGRFSGKERKDYVMLNDRSGNPRGIFKRSGTALIPILWFVKQKRYAKRFKFYESANSEISSNLVGYLRKYTAIAIERAAAR